MVIYDLDLSKEIFLKIKFEDGQFAGQRIHFDQFGTCGTATCDCYSLHVSDGERKFIFEVDEQSVTTLEEDDEAFAEAIEAELTEEIWNDLYEVFSFVKGLECDLTPISAVTKHFSEDEYKNVLRDSTMFYYDEIFPHAMDFSVTVDEVKYGLMDLYCLHPSCDCNNVVLQVLDPEHNKLTLSIIHHIERNTFKIDTNERIGVSKDKAEAILAEIKTEFSEAKIAGISYANRYTRMRGIFRNFLIKNKISQSYHPETRLAVTIGRNEDCPCGSGKKYKKCCGK